MLDRAQILRVHDVGAVLVFQDRHQLARALRFLDQIGLVGQRMARLLVQGREGIGLFQCLFKFQRDHLHRAQVAAGVFAGVFHFVVPAAGIGARALVRVAVIEVARQQATARIGDAQRAMHEYFQFHLRAALADFLDLVERQFARQDHARQAHAVPEFHVGPVDGIRLHRQVHRHLRPLVAHHHDQAGVGHDQRIGPHGDHRFHVAQIRFQLGVVGEDIAGDKELLAARMRTIYAFLQRLQGGKVVIAHAQAVARLPRIDGVGAIVEGGVHLGQRAGRQE